MQTQTIMAFIAGYAAVISTITLIWNIATAINQNKAKLKVSAYTTASFEAIPGIGAVSKTSWNLSVDIVNLSKSKKYINRPLLLFPKKINGENRFQCLSMNDQTKYPIVLESGEKHTMHMQLGENLFNLLNKTNSKKLRILVKDTSDKEYLSNKMKIVQLKSYCKM